MLYPVVALVVAPESAIEGVTPLGPTDTDGGFTTPAVEDSGVTGEDTEVEGEANTPTAAAAPEETDAEGLYRAYES